MPAVISVFGVEPFRIGGTETFARELSAQLAAAGCESILCFLSKATAPVEEFLRLPNVSIEVLADSANFNLGATRNLARILKRYKPEVLHLHFTGFLGAYPWVGRLCSVKKVFFTDHTSRPAGYLAHRAPFWKRTLVRVINWHLTNVVCVSEYGFRCLTALDLLPQKRFEMIYNGVDLSRVSPDPKLVAAFRHKYAIPDNRAIVTQVSWMIPQKGVPELLRVARLVRSKTDAVQFVLVGEGDFREQYMKDAQELGLGDHITWTGMVEDPFGDGVFDAADVVCQLSSWEEVFGWMIAEGMAYSKPVVATRVGGIPELVVDGSTGFLVEPGAIQMMAGAILKLLADGELRKRFGNAGRLRTSEKFCLRRNVQRLIELYGIEPQPTHPALAAAGLPADFV